MKKILTALGCMFVVSLITAGSAMAIAISLSPEGMLMSTPGVAPTPTEVGTYISGGTGLTGTGGSWPADNGGGLGDDVPEGSSIDRYWVQFDSTTPGSSGSLLYDFTTPTSSILGVAGLDHGPTPYESLEFVIWGQDLGSGAWEEGMITAVFDMGVDAAWAADDFSSIWSFNGSYTRFAVSGGTHMTNIGGSEGEIDAIASYANPIPEPASILLLGTGLLGLLFYRRKSS